MNTATALNYKLKKDDNEHVERKIVTNHQLGTNFYYTVLFYKHLTRYFLPITSNEQS
jgi:protein involved in sex pheromone biosynthesis